LFYKIVIKPILFGLAPERAHHVTIGLLKFVCRLPFAKSILRAMYCVEDARLEREVFGIKFPNMVGLAAGFDKDGKFFREMALLGFGYIELGTVTPKPQDGNPQPRLFRLPKSKALVNRMGFNNEGVDGLAERLKQYRLEMGKTEKQIIIGGNIGKNKLTPNEQAFDDYAYCFEKLFDYVDYFVVNVSSPNTPDLRALQEKQPLMQLLSGLQKLNHAKHNPKPILLKIAPDLTTGQLDDIIEIVEHTKLAGVIATNTTIGRRGLLESPELINAIGAGGLSGAPVKDQSTQVIRYLKEKSMGKIEIIGVGGIATAQDAQEKIKAGATLIQVYSGFIYEGPGMVARIVDG
jgi:dihydroorotate dehydrogenase